MYQEPVGRLSGKPKEGTPYVRPPKPEFQLEVQHPDMVEFRELLREVLPAEEVKGLDPTFGGLYRIFRHFKQRVHDLHKHVAELEAELGLK